MATTTEEKKTMEQNQTNYSRPVTFTETNLYGCGTGDDVYTVEEFRERVAKENFRDYDGFGYPVKDSKADPSIWIKPSNLDEIPSDATHIVWFNK